MFVSFHTYACPSRKNHKKLRLTINGLGDRLFSMDLSTFYKTTYTSEYNRQPSWKQKAIDEDIREKNLSGLTDDFIRSVITSAENQYEQHVLEKKAKVTKKPKKSPKSTKPKKTAASKR